MIPYTGRIYKALKKELEEDILSRFQIVPCGDCMRPIVDGFCCMHCGSTNPKGL